MKDNNQTSLHFSWKATPGQASKATFNGSNPIGRKQFAVKKRDPKAQNVKTLKRKVNQILNNYEFIYKYIIFRLFT